MRRKKGNLTEIEGKLMDAAYGLQCESVTEFHGFRIARDTGNCAAAKNIPTGSLYRALDRLEKMGCLTSRMEDPAAAAEERRPRRRLYSISTNEKEHG